MRPNPCRERKTQINERRGSVISLPSLSHLCSLWRENKRFQSYHSSPPSALRGLLESDPSLLRQPQVLSRRVSIKSLCRIHPPSLHQPTSNKLSVCCIWGHILKNVLLFKYRFSPVIFTKTNLSSDWNGEGTDLINAAACPVATCNPLRVLELELWRGGNKKTFSLRLFQWPGLGASV